MPSRDNTICTTSGYKECFICFHAIEQWTQQEGSSLFCVKFACSHCIRGVIWIIQIVLKGAVSLLPRMLLHPQSKYCGAWYPTMIATSMYCLNYLSYCHNGRANLGTFSTESQHYARERGSDNLLVMSPFLILKQFISKSPQWPTCPLWTNTHSIIIPHNVVENYNEPFRFSNVWHSKYS